MSDYFLLKNRINPIPFADSARELFVDLLERGIIHLDSAKQTYFLDPIVNTSATTSSLDFENVAIKQKKSKVNSRSEINIHSEVIRGVDLPIPLIASNMSTVTSPEFCILLEKLGSMGVLHRAETDDTLVDWTQQIAKENKWVAVSVGIGESQFDLAKKLINSGANIIFIDVAHGYCDAVIALGKTIKQFASHVHVVVGNTINPGLIIESSDFASAVKVGIAQGGACLTKNTAGVTDKQFSAVQKCLVASKKYGMPLISDGGTREPADFVKAIAAGASCVMAGKIFAACPESAAILTKEGKLYAGMSSRFVQEKWHGFVKNGAPEGKTVYLPLGESAENLLNRYSGSLRSGISYAGCTNIQEFKGAVEFNVFA